MQGKRQPSWYYINESQEHFEKRQITGQWYADNFQHINEVLLRYIDRGIGWIPLSNILPEVKEYDEEYLSRVLQEDGLRCRYNGNGVSVYL